MTSVGKFEVETESNNTARIGVYVDKIGLRTETPLDRTESDSSHERDLRRGRGRLDEEDDEGEEGGEEESGCGDEDDRV